MNKSILLLLALSFPVTAFGEVRFDKTVHDWGDVTISQGPLSCRFVVTNDGKEDVSITSVVSSCGCTGVKWTREALKSGSNGYIDATYSNDEGPYPFDKTLSVYLSSERKPVTLHLKGVVHKTKMPLDKTHPVHFGPLALRSDRVKAGYMVQGGVRSGQISLANISGRPIEVSFADVPEQVAIGSATVAPGKTADVQYSVSASRKLWGRNDYPLTVLVDGKPVGGTLTLWAVTKENFSDWTADMKADAPVLEVSPSNFSFGPVHSGQKVNGEFVFRNKGKSTLIIYKVECDNPRIVTELSGRREIPHGGRLNLTFDLNTEGMRTGADDVSIIEVYTNCPGMPVAYLYISGVIAP